MTSHKTWPGPVLELLAAADAAMRQVPPAFPLEATVAVNPWLGQVPEARTQAAARLARVGGGRMFLPREQIVRMIDAGEITAADLAKAAAAHGIDTATLAQAAREATTPQAPAPTVAELAMTADGIDWPALIEERFGLWAAAHFDRGQAFWPTAGGAAWDSWRAYASRDLTPGLAGLSGFAARVAATPTETRAAFAQACQTLGLKGSTAPVYFHRLFITLSGWAQYARHLDWTAERDGDRDGTLFDLLTIRLMWEAALLDQGDQTLSSAWQSALAGYAAPITADKALVLDAALQEAADYRGERRLAETLAQTAQPQAQGRPALQAAFCIDVRSEILRRALEGTEPQMQTLGFAGFFGLAVKHRDHASDIDEARAPILLNPGIQTATKGQDGEDRVRLRTTRAWGRFKRAAVSAFAFVEAAGPLYIGKLVRDGLGHGAQPATAPAPTLDLPLADRIEGAAKILRAMSLTTNFARLVLICGHGAHVTNAPHASALQCGACGGHAGDVNARLLAMLLNDDAVRDGLAAKGLVIPADTRFVAGLHDTVSDEVQIFKDTLPPSHAPDLQRLRAALSKAAVLARSERALKLPRGVAGKLAARGRDWSELRPEWGLAGCRGFIAAPRSRTAGRDFGGEVFLHDYDWQQDKGAATLELILSAPVVVASWIALQYHGSAVAPETFGGGNKLLHNVVGGIGVLEGNGGALRVGLPWQSVHDGNTLRHVPSRLVVAVEAPEAMISDVLARQPNVRALFDNGWLTLVTIDDTGAMGRRYEQGVWVDRDPVRSDLRNAA